MPPLDEDTVQSIRAAADGAIARGELHGAVIAVARRRGLAFLEAFGARRVKPAVEPMTPDAVFDLASLTKAVATAPCVHLLVADGEVDLAAPVARYLPAFAANGKADITVEDLLLHRGGLLADDALSDYRQGRDAALARVLDLAPATPRGARFVYSDLGYIVLGALVEKVSGKSLADFAKERLFGPLGMTDTSFVPDARLRSRAVPTEPRDGHMLEGEVHDPRAAGLSGIAGHAGLFSTASDLARFASMLLAKGGGLFSPASFARLTEPVLLPGGALRSRGFDVKSGYSGARGELGGFGHTGFTGTSMWIDPEADLAVIVLSSRLHPDGKGDSRRLAREVAKALTHPVRPLHLATGVDVLEREGFRLLQGRKVGLVTNATGADSRGRSTIDALREAPGVTLVALFAPEHGLRGEDDAPIGDGSDPETHLPVYSLYGKRQRPTDAELAGIDTLVFDLADAGARFFTFETTLGYLLEVAAAHRIRVVVLDRPNPIGGVSIEGPELDPDARSFIGYHPIPVRHGMTLGELARLWNAERHLGADLEVVRVEGWRRTDLFDATGLSWVNPSPNLRSLDEALAYPGVALLEATNVSVGRGTDRPFEQIGAPWMEGARVAQALAALALPGVSFSATNFTPTESTFAGKRCGGVALHIDDRARFEPVRTGLAIAHVLLAVHRNAWKPDGMKLLLGNASTFAAVLRGDDPAAIVRSYQAGIEAFRARRGPYLLY